MKAEGHHLSARQIGSTLTERVTKTTLTFQRPSKPKKTLSRTRKLSEFLSVTLQAALKKRKRKAQRLPLRSKRQPSQLIYLRLKMTMKSMTQSMTTNTMTM